MKAKAKSTAEISAPDSRLMLEDHRLKNRYSVIEIATLAAACRGKTPTDRIEDAIQLLSAVESSASISKAEKLRETIRQTSIARGDLKGTAPEKIDSKIWITNRAKDQLDKWDQILKTVDRDNTTGKIERSSLTYEICKAANLGIATKEHANRLYREWLKSDLAECATLYEVVSLDDRLSQFETRSKIPLIHDDGTARSIIIAFSGWLETRPKGGKPEIIQSQKADSKGKIVSPKTRGAVRDGDGKFSPP